MESSCGARNEEVHGTALLLGMLDMSRRWRRPMIPSDLKACVETLRDPCSCRTTVQSRLQLTNEVFCVVQINYGVRKNKARFRIPQLRKSSASHHMDTFETLTLVRAYRRTNYQDDLKGTSRNSYDGYPVGINVF
jgi:hypothetical protein